MASAFVLFQRAEKAMERLSLAYSLWPLIPAGAVGVASGWAARGSATINQFGTVGWLAAGVLGFLLTSIGFLALALAKEKLISAKAFSDWTLPTDAANPMADNYNRQRIAIRDIAHPVTNRIVGKTFTQCEIIGPANIILWGKGTVAGVGFMDCDIVVVKDNTFVRNIFVLENCNLVGGSIWRCTVFMPEDMFRKVQREIPSFEAITHMAPTGPAA